MKNAIKYHRINGGHSVGQELEYRMSSSDHFYDYRDKTHLAVLIWKRLGLKKGWNLPKVYNDGAIELCSSPQRSIAELYDQMKKMYDVLHAVSVQKGLTIDRTAHTTNGKWAGPSGNQVHVGTPLLVKKKFFAALLPYAPLFAGFANNSSTEKYPHGSSRLLKHTYGANVYSYFLRHTTDFLEILGKDSVIAPHNKAPTLEVRCMDRGKTLEDDIAAAALVFATAEYLKQQPELRLLGGRSSANVMKTTTEFLYGCSLGDPTGRQTDVQLALSWLQDLFDNVKEAGLTTVTPEGETLTDVMSRHLQQIEPWFFEVGTPLKIIDRIYDKVSNYGREAE